MPLVRINTELHFFAHVPKCAGASVEAYLRNRFGEIAFQNSSFLKVPEAQRWTKSSPQHVDAKSLELLIPPSWIASSFSVVRHPVSRLRSAFDYQRTGEKTLDEKADINAWIEAWANTRDAKPFQFDNHPRPAHELIPKGAKIFRMEDGLDGLVDHLDTLEGTSRGARAIGHENQSRSGSAYLGEQSALTSETLRLIGQIYKKDFAQFGYVCEDVSRTTKTAQTKPPARKSLKQILGF